MKRFAILTAIIFSLAGCHRVARYHIVNGPDKSFIECRRNSVCWKEMTAFCSQINQTPAIIEAGHSRKETWYAFVCK